MASFVATAQGACRSALLRLAVLCALILPALALPMSARADVTATVRALLADPEVGLAEAKVAIDAMVDPGTDPAAVLGELDRMTAEIDAMVPAGADDWERLGALRAYLYEPGPWNGERVFGYDHADPYGQRLENALLADYLADRLGNCVTMPILFAALGERLGLDVTLASAPLHVFVVFTDADGMRHNLETTSGAGLTRARHYRDNLPITEAAVQSGIYLRPLTSPEAKAVAASTLVSALIDAGLHAPAIEVADALLEHHPRFVHVLLKKGTAAARLMRTEFEERYPNAADVPHELWPRYRGLHALNAAAFAEAEAMGWVPHPLPTDGLARR